MMGIASINSVVTAVLARTPDWIRKDLATHDAMSRQRAEEALAAMIVAALESTSNG